jgi:hypothetical protein
MEKCWLKLPIELVNIILSYNGSIKYRSGEYIDQIASDDMRYSLLLTIQPKIFNLYETHIELSNYYNKNLFIIDMDNFILYEYVYRDWAVYMLKSEIYIRY